MLPQCTAFAYRPAYIQEPCQTNSPMQKSAESIEQIRTRICALRRQLSPQAASAAGASAARRLSQLPEFSSAIRIAAYLPVNGEVGTEFVIRAAWQQNKRVYLPVLQTAGTLLFAPYNPDSRMHSNRYQILEPEITGDDPPLPAAAMDLLIVPLVAFDRRCQRIGMGAGYYDRTFAGYNSNKPVRIGLAYEFQQVATIQAQAWDIPMHKIVTEDRVFIRPDES
jgi:5-formyltetrahydrofolate cyclo-ligase